MLVGGSPLGHAVSYGEPQIPTRSAVPNSAQAAPSATGSSAASELPALQALRDSAAAFNPADTTLTATEKALGQRDPIGLALTRSLKVKVDAADPQEATWLRQLAHEDPVRYALLKASGWKTEPMPPKRSPGQSLLGFALERAKPHVRQQIAGYMAAASQLRAEQLAPRIDALLAQGKDAEAFAYLKTQTEAAFSQPEQHALWAQVQDRFSDTYFQSKVQARVDQEHSHAGDIYGDRVPRGIGVGLYLQEMAPHMPPAAAQRLAAFMDREIKADWYIDDQFDRASYELFQGYSGLAESSQAPGTEDNPVARHIAHRMTENPDTSDDELAQFFMSMSRAGSFAEVKESVVRGDAQLTQAIVQALDKKGDPFEIKPKFEFPLNKGAERYQTDVLNPKHHAAFVATGKEQNVKDRLAQFAQEAPSLKLDPSQLSDAQLHNFIGIAFGLSPDDKAAFQSADAARAWYAGDNLKALQTVSATLKDNIAPGTQAQLILGVASGRALGVQNAVFLQYRGKDGMLHLMDQRGWDSKGNNVAELTEDFQHGSAYTDDTEITFAKGALEGEGNAAPNGLKLVSNSSSAAIPAAPIRAHITTNTERAKTAGDIAIPVASAVFMPVTGGQSGWAAVAWGGYRSGEQLYDLHAHSQSLSSQQAIMGPWLGLLSTLAAPAGAGLAAGSLKATGRTAAALETSAKAVQVFASVSGAVMAEEQVRMMATQPMSAEEFALSFAMLAGGAVPMFMPKGKAQPRQSNVHTERAKPQDSPLMPPLAQDLSWARSPEAVPVGKTIPKQEATDAVGASVGARPSSPRQDSWRHSEASSQHHPFASRGQDAARLLNAMSNGGGRVPVAARSGASAPALGSPSGWVLDLGVWSPARQDVSRNPLREALGPPGLHERHKFKILGRKISRAPRTLVTRANGFTPHTGPGGEVYQTRILKVSLLNGEAIDTRFVATQSLGTQAVGPRSAADIYVPGVSDALQAAKARFVLVMQHGQPVLDDNGLGLVIQRLRGGAANDRTRLERVIQVFQGALNRMGVRGARNEPDASMPMQAHSETKAPGRDRSEAPQPAPPVVDVSLLPEALRPKVGESTAAYLLRATSLMSAENSAIFMEAAALKMPFPTARQLPNAVFQPPVCEVYASHRLEGTPEQIRAHALAQLARAESATEAQSFAHVPEVPVGQAGLLLFNDTVRDRSIEEYTREIMFADRDLVPWPTDLIRSLGGARIVNLGGGAANLRNELWLRGVEVASVVNVEPFPEPSSMRYRDLFDRVVQGSAADPHLLDRAKALSPGMADEVWAMYSVPFYLADGQQIETMLSNGARLLAPGGNLRVWPLALNSASASPASKTERRAALISGIRRLADAGYGVDVVDTAGGPWHTLIVHRPASMRDEPQAVDIAAEPRKVTVMRPDGKTPHLGTEGQTYEAEIYSVALPDGGAQQARLVAMERRGTEPVIPSQDAIEIPTPGQRPTLPFVLVVDKGRPVLDNTGIGFVARRAGGGALSGDPGPVAPQPAGQPSGEQGFILPPAMQPTEGESPAGYLLRRSVLLAEQNQAPRGPEFAQHVNFADPANAQARLHQAVWTTHRHHRPGSRDAVAQHGFDQLDALMQSRIFHMATTVPLGRGDAALFAQTQRRRTLEQYIGELIASQFDLRASPGLRDIFAGRRIVNLGGGEAQLAAALRAHGIEPASVHNVEPYPSADMLINPSDYDPLIEASVGDPNLLHNSGVLSPGTADEVWAMYSVPFYLRDGNEVVVMLRQSAELLAPGGNLRIWPLLLNSLRASPASQMERREALNFGLAMLINDGYAIDVVTEPVRRTMTLIVHRPLNHPPSPAQSHLPVGRETLEVASSPVAQPQAEAAQASTQLDKPPQREGGSHQSSPGAEPESTTWKAEWTQLLDRLAVRPENAALVKRLTQPGMEEAFSPRAGESDAAYLLRSSAALYRESILIIPRDQTGAGRIDPSRMDYAPIQAFLAQTAQALPAGTPSQIRAHGQEQIRAFNAKKKGIHDEVPHVPVGQGGERLFNRTARDRTLDEHFEKLVAVRLRHQPRETLPAWLPFENARIVSFGGGNVALKEEFAMIGVGIRSAVNVEPFPSQPDPDDFRMRDPVIAKSAADRTLLQTEPDLQPGSADEVWAMFSVPFYLSDGPQIETMLANGAGLLAPGGYLRVWPMTLNSAGSTRDKLDARRAAMVNGIQRLSDAGYSVDVIETAGNYATLIVHRPESMETIPDLWTDLPPPESAMVTRADGHTPHLGAKGETEDGPLFMLTMPDGQVRPARVVVLQKRGTPPLMPSSEDDIWIPKSDGPSAEESSARFTLVVDKQGQAVLDENGRALVVLRVGG